MESCEIVEGILEESMVDFLEEALRSARNAKEADSVVANFLTGILHQPRSTSKTWH
jgi:hypothetical protein